MMFLKISQNSQENTSASVSFLITLQHKNLLNNIHEKFAKFLNDRKKRICFISQKSLYKRTTGEVVLSLIFYL